MKIKVAEFECYCCGKAVKNDDVFCSEECEQEYDGKELYRCELCGEVFADDELEECDRCGKFYCGGCGTTHTTPAVLYGLLEAPADYENVCFECIGERDE